MPRTTLSGADASAASRSASPSELRRLPEVRAVEPREASLLATEPRDASLLAAAEPR